MWIDDRKIAALGVQISTGIALHGTALNVTTDLKHFEHIIPCGLPDFAVTSVEKETANAARLDEVSSTLRTNFLEVFKYEEVRQVAADKLLNSTSNEIAVLESLEHGIQE